MRAALLVLMLAVPMAVHADQPVPLGVAPAAGSQSPKAQPSPTMTVPPVSIPSGAPQQGTVETAPSGPTGSTKAMPEKGIKVDTLAAPDPDSLGVLDIGDGGFPADMWAGSDRGLIARLLKTLPAKTKSPVVYDLMRRLLLTTATAPTGGAGGVSLTGLRVDRLKSMGDLEGVTNLLRAARVTTKNAMLARAELDVLLLRYDNAGACEAARAGIQLYPTVYWQKAMIFCHALAGDGSKAVLGMDLLREQGDQDTLFAALVGSLVATGSAPIESLQRPTPLHLAMLRAARRPLRSGLALADDPGLLRAVAVSPNADLDLRLDAAERAVAFRALPPKFLAELYATLEFNDEELADAKSIGNVEWTPRGRARLNRILTAETAATVRAELLRNFWSAAREQGGYFTVVRLTLPMLERIQPSPDFAWFAADVGRAFLAVGRGVEARKWLEIAQGLGRSNPEATEAATALWPLAKLVDAEGLIEWQPDALAAWWKAQEASDWDLAARRAELLYSLLESFGHAVPGDAWTPLYGRAGTTGAALPVAAVWHGLRAAAAAGRVGETILHVLIILGEEGPARISPTVLQEAIAALRQVGLDADARAVAVEAVIAAGL